MRLVLQGTTTDEAVGMLVRRFPAVASVEVERIQAWAAMADVGLRALR
jgi:hypothetical protein